jgi:drug/metabolite transporter (DMT)-like permease
MAAKWGARLNVRLRADLILLLTAAIWGSAFIFQRISAAESGVLLYNGSRFLLGALVVLPLAYRGWRNRTTRLRRVDLPWVGLTGLLLLAGSGFQQWGIRYTTASNAGFVTGLTVALVPLFVALIGRGWPRPVGFFAAGLAMLGLFLLSTEGRLTMLSYGDTLVFLSTFVWAWHVILVGDLLRRMDVYQLAAGQFVVCGLASLAGGLLFEADRVVYLMPHLTSILYTGVVSVGIGYTLQLVGQRHAPPVDAIIILSGESVFAALFGWLLLHEQLSAIQLLGCVLILGGALLSQMALLFRSNPMHVETA